VTALTRAELGLVAIALLAAATTGQLILVAFAAPIALALVAGFVAGRPPAPIVTTSVEPLVVALGRPVRITLEIVSPVRQSALVSLDLPVRVAAGGPSRWLVQLRPGVVERLECDVSTTRPGRLELGTARLACGPPSRQSVRTFRLGQSHVVEVRPAGVRTAGLVRSARVRGLVGDRVSPLGGEGIEFADVREAPGAVASRRVNWRASARRGTTCVNVYHPERSTDVVLIVDTFSEAALPSVVAPALNVAESYLARHDRVAVVCFGGVLDWVEPGTGPRHLERVRRALLESEAFFSYAWKTADIIPRRLLPSGALVLALSPLVDSRFNTVLVGLRGRGTDVAVLEIPLPDGLGTTRRDTASGDLARRILELEHEELRLRLASFGIPVVELAGSGALGVALSQLNEIRRKASRSPRTRLAR
jgi:uncharacterized protein (DUF58 family)